MFKAAALCTRRASAIGRSAHARMSTLSQETYLYTWGEGGDGQLGHGKGLPEETTGLLVDYRVAVEPRKVTNSKRFKNVAIGPNWTLAVSDTNDLYAWGKNYMGKDSSSLEPVHIAPGLKVKSVASGYKHSAAIGVDGLVYTWGYGGSWFRGGGQLGHGGTGSEDKPRLVDAFQQYGAKAKQVSLGQSHTVILTEDGEVLCCGVGEYGRQGTGNTLDAEIPTPLESLGDEEVVQVAAGQDHTLALTSTGAIYSWGRNQSGQLGHSDSYIDIYSMEDFPRMIDAESVNNKENEEALLKDNLKTNHHPEFKQVVAGSSRSAALTTDGLMYIWGARVGHQPKLLGPSQFGGKRVIKIGCGGDLGKSAFAAVTEDNSLWMLGDASSHLLGTPGLKGRQTSPVLVKRLAGHVMDIFCGFGQHMAAKVTQLPGKDAAK